MVDIRLKTSVFGSFFFENRECSDFNWRKGRSLFSPQAKSPKASHVSGVQGQSCRAPGKILAFWNVVNRKYVNKKRTENSCIAYLARWFLIVQTIRMVSWILDTYFFQPFVSILDRKFGEMQPSWKSADFADFLVFKVRRFLQIFRICRLCRLSENL